MRLRHPDDLPEEFFKESVSVEAVAKLTYERYITDFFGYNPRTPYDLLRRRTRTREKSQGPAMRFLSCVLSYVFRRQDRGRRAQASRGYAVRPAAVGGAAETRRSCSLAISSGSSLARLKHVALLFLRALKVSLSEVFSTGVFDLRDF